MPVTCFIRFIDSFRFQRFRLVGHILKLRMLQNQSDGFALNDLISQNVHQAALFELGTHASRRFAALGRDQEDFLLIIAFLLADFLFLGDSLQDGKALAVESRRAWFEEFDSSRRPLWVLDDLGTVAAWLSLRSFYGRPAYHATVEIAVYCAPGVQRRQAYPRRLESFGQRGRGVVGEGS